MVAVVDTISRYMALVLICTNQPNKSKLALYEPLIHIYSRLLKQLYIHNKTIIKVGVRGRHTHIMF